MGGGPLFLFILGQGDHAKMAEDVRLLAKLYIIADTSILVVGGNSPLNQFFQLFL